MHLAICRWDGKVISSPKYNNIQRSADIYTERLIKLARMHPNSRTDVTKLPTKSDIKKWFNAEYSQAILNLEKDQKLLRLCAGHWKADTMLGQAITRSNVMESKRAKARKNVVSSDQFPMPDPSEPLIPAPFLQAVASLNVAKCALELSPGPKSPSASHIQKRSKDEAAVLGQKTNAPYVPSNRKPFFPQHGNSNHQLELTQKSHALSHTSSLRHSSNTLWPRTSLHQQTLLPSPPSLMFNLVCPHCTFGLSQPDLRLDHIGVYS
jgi:hypothetical protein